MQGPQRIRAAILLCGGLLGAVGGVTPAEPAGAPPAPAKAPQGVVAPAALAAPVIGKVEPTADGYALVGKGFGTDSKRVEVFEWKTQVPASAITFLANDRIVVRSRATGTVEHRVVVGGQASQVVTFEHRAAPPARADRAPAPVPSVTQSLTTAEISMVGRRGAGRPGGVPPVPSVTQTLTTGEVSMAGRRGAPRAGAPPTVPSVTQTLTTQEVSMTGRRGGP